MKTNLFKMFRDMRYYKGSTALTLIGIFIGIASFGAVLASYTLLDREMNSNFMNTNPASVILQIDNLDLEAVDIIKQSYKNIDIEVRKTTPARIARGDGTYGVIYLRAIQDFTSQKVDTFSLEQGTFPTNPYEMVLERDSLKILSNIKESVNESAIIKLPGQAEIEMRLSGRVHAPGLAPASMEHYSYGFLTLEDLQNLGYEGWYNELRIVNYENRLDYDEMKKAAENMKQLLLEKGYKLSWVEVPRPGNHPHADQLASLLFLLQAFAVIALIAACMIIINLISFILSKQVKQIAIMKAVGGGTKDIITPYFIYLLVLGMAASTLSIPVSILIAYGYSSFAAGILNFNITDFTIPYWVFGVQVLVGIFIPIAAGAYPIYRGCIKSVKEGLSDVINLQSEGNKKYVYTKNKRIKLSSKILISINNLLRKKRRALIAISALAVGGIIFMTTQNMIAALDKTVDSTFSVFLWDYDIRLSSSYPEDKIKEVIRSIEGIDQYEVWQTSGVILKSQEDVDNVHSKYYPIKIVPEGSTMINLPLLKELDIKAYKNKIVVNNALIENESWIQKGATVTIEMGGKIQEAVIAEVVNEVPPIPVIYMAQSTYEELFGFQAKQSILAGANTRDIEKQREITRNIEMEFKEAGIEIVENWNIYVLKKAFIDHLLVMISFLSAIAILAIIVGGLSIGSSIGINILERKREIGVFQAVGASKRQIMLLTLLEVFLMGIIGWFVGVIFSYPLSIFVGNYFGQICLSTDLQPALSMQGVVSWLFISVFTSLISGVLPIWQATTIPLRDLLVYE